MRLLWTGTKKPARSGPSVELRESVEVPHLVRARAFDQGDGVLTVAAGDIAFATARNGLAIHGVVDPVPVPTVVFTFDVTGI